MADLAAAAGAASAGSPVTLGWLQRDDASWSRIDDEGRENTMAFGLWDNGTQLRELDADVRAALAVLDALEAAAE
ncbi:hypothetical protein [Nocardia sp. NPDC060259]|uniref:hypothetical protein n=1 Tax=Nocardia sp. NPDC060259 TaxID=3347088 RepID=UPI00365D1381